MKTGSYRHLRSLTQSHQAIIETEIKGKIPNWLSGTLYRNGPGRYHFGDKKYNHLFDGSSCIHKFEIRNEKIFYSNKFLETNSYQRSINENQLNSEFGTAGTNISLLERIKNTIKGKSTDNVNVNIVPFGKDQLYALTETNMICKIDPQDLKILNTLNITDSIPSANTIIAHPQMDNEGNHFTVGINTKKKIPHYEFIKFTPNQNKLMTETGKVIASIPSNSKNGLSYFHSFAMTNNYIIFLEQSLIINIFNLLIGLITNKAFSHSFTMKKDYRTRIHIINRHTGDVLKQKLSTEPLFSFHHINAYENDNEIIVDLCAYDTKSFDISKLTFNNFLSDEFLKTKCFNPSPKRIKLPILINSNAAEINCEIHNLNSNINIELPTINYSNFNGIKYKFVYGSNWFTNPFSVIKLNVDNPLDYLEFKYDNCFPSEPVFVPFNNSKNEDDGVLLVLVLSDKKDYLSILNAQNMKELARAEIPENIKAATTFHGFFRKE